MKILLTGASGFLGCNISALLLASGHHVIPVSRTHGVDFNTMLSPEQWLPYLEGVDAVINCVGIIGETKKQPFKTLHTLAPMALFKACLTMGISKVIQVSALGADDSAFSQYHLSKLKADTYLRSLDLDWLVLHPSLIYGEGGTSTQAFMKMAKLPLVPVIGEGQQLIQPIHINDVAATVLQSLTTSKTRQTLDVVGTEVISFKDWLQRMRQAQGLAKGREIHIPLSLVAFFFQLGGYVSPMLHPDNLRMLQASYQANSQPLTHFLGRAPELIQDELFFTSIAKNEAFTWST